MLKSLFSNPLIQRQIRQGFAIKITANTATKHSLNKIGGNPIIPIAATLAEAIIEEYTLLLQMDLSTLAISHYPFFKNKWLYIFIKFKDIATGEFEDIKIMTFDQSDNYKEQILQQKSGANKELSIVEFYNLNPIYTNDPSIQAFLNEADWAAYKTLKANLAEHPNCAYGNYFLGVKEGGPGDPDITWTGMADIPALLTGERTVDEEVLSIANEYESLFDLSPYDSWEFFDEDMWSFSIKIGLKKTYLNNGDLTKLVIGY